MTFESNIHNNYQINNCYHKNKNHSNKCVTTLTRNAIKSHNKIECYVLFDCCRESFEQIIREREREK